MSSLSFIPPLALPVSPKYIADDACGKRPYVLIVEWIYEGNCW